MEQNNQTQQNVELLENEIDNAIETGLTPDKYPHLSTFVTDNIMLQESLPMISRKLAEFKDKMSQCDDRAKMFSENKKEWKARTDQLTDFVAFLMAQGNVKSIIKDKCKATISSRTILETDDDGILALYQNVVDSITAALPPYIKVTLSINKTALNSYCTQDTSLMIQHPELVHSKEKKSITIK